MTDPGQTTIRMQETQGTKPNGSKASVSVKTLGMKMIRPLTYFVVGIVILFAGWGAWNYFGSGRDAEEADSIADLDGLEFPAQAFDSSKPSKPGSGAPVRMASSTGTASERSNPSDMKDPNSVNGQIRSEAVWLTGTIEVIDRSDSVESPRRISGGPGESSNLR